GDAHGNLLLFAEGENDVGPEEEFRPGELNFVPWDAQRRMANAEQKQNRCVECIRGSGEANRAAVVAPPPHVNTVKERPCAANLAVRLRLLFESPRQREPAGEETDQ